MLRAPQAAGGRTPPRVVVSEMSYRFCPPGPTARNAARLRGFALELA